MTAYTVLALLFGWGVQPWVWAVLLAFLLAGAVGQAVALRRCSRFGRWLFPAVLVVLWFLLELIAPHTVNFVQFYALYLLGAVLFCLAGALLGSAAAFVGRRIQLKNSEAK